MRVRVVVEVIVVPRNAEARFRNDDSSDSVVGLHTTARSQAHNDHFALYNGSAFSNEKVNHRESHSNSNNRNGHSLVGARQRKEVALRVKREDRCTTVECFGDAVSSHLIADGDDPVSDLAGFGGYVVGASLGILLW